MRIEFSVPGRPPKKPGYLSAYNHKGGQVPQVILLRERALKARTEAGLSACFPSWVSLELTIFIPQAELRRFGDLDTRIAGICESLQSAHGGSQSHPSPLFFEPGREDIQPSKKILIENDNRVIAIIARKCLLPPGEQAHYTVAIEPVDPS